MHDTQEPFTLYLAVTGILSEILSLCTMFKPQSLAWLLLNLDFSAFGVVSGDISNALDHSLG